MYIWQVILVLLVSHNGYLRNSIHFGQTNTTFLSLALVLGMPCLKKRSGTKVIFRLLIFPHAFPNCIVNDCSFLDKKMDHPAIAIIESLLATAHLHCERLHKESPCCVSYWTHPANLTNTRSSRSHARVHTWLRNCVNWLTAAVVLINSPHQSFAYVRVATIVNNVIMYIKVVNDVYCLVMSFREPATA